MSKQSFADLGVSSAVCGALTRRGITEPFPVQRLILGDVLAGRDVLAKSPTGSGKTLAFGIPLAERIAADGPRPAALVLVPTRELAGQVVHELRDIARSRALRITAVYGGVGLMRQAAAAAGSHVLVATPGRLEDLLQRGAFTLEAIRMLVLDEADRMLDMGFRPAIDRLVEACPTARQTLFFSATLDGVAGQLAARYTNRAIAHEHGPAGRRATSDVEHRFVAVRNDARIEALVAELGRERGLALVFVRTKRGADRLVKRLGAHGVHAIAIHGNKSQRQREQALSRFQAGRVDTLVATDVAARGIDVDGISHVINFDPPDDHDAYIHRIGRAGRAGRRGVGITLVGDGERSEMRRLAGGLGLAHGLGGAEERGRTHGGGAARHERPRSTPRRHGPRARQRASGSQGSPTPALANRGGGPPVLNTRPRGKSSGRKWN
jgi:superfamily II DNA/RNA helicase